MMLLSRQLTTAQKAKKNNDHSKERERSSQYISPSRENSPPNISKQSRMLPNSRGKTGKSKSGMDSALSSAMPTPKKEMNLTCLRQQIKDFAILRDTGNNSLASTPIPPGRKRSPAKGTKDPMRKGLKDTTGKALNVTPLAGQKEQKAQKHGKGSQPLTQEHPCRRPDTEEMQEYMPSPFEDTMLDGPCQFTHQTLMERIQSSLVKMKSVSRGGNFIVKPHVKSSPQPPPDGFTNAFHLPQQADEDSGLSNVLPSHSGNNTNGLLSGGASLGFPEWKSQMHGSHYGNLGGFGFSIYSNQFISDDMFLPPSPRVNPQPERCAVTTAKKKSPKATRNTPQTAVKRNGSSKQLLGTAVKPTRLVGSHSAQKIFLPLEEFKSWLKPKEEVRVEHLPSTQSNHTGRTMMNGSRSNWNSNSRSQSSNRARSKYFSNVAQPPKLPKKHFASNLYKMVYCPQH